MKVSSVIFGIIFFVVNPAYCDVLIANLQFQSKVKTDILVLGSTHLSSVKAPIDPSSLAPVINILADFKPSAIAVESLRPQDIATMINSANEYQPVLKQFVGETLLNLAREEQRSLAVTTKDAINKLSTLLAVSNPTTKQRVEIIRFAIASYNKDTAVLHWRYLNNETTKAGISAELSNYLNTLVTSNNEKIIIATELASKLNLNRLYSIDDHLDKDMYPQVVQQLMPSYMKSKDGAALAQSEYANMAQVMQAQALETGDWLPLFTWFNSKEYMSQVLNKEWKLFVDSDIDSNAGAARIALWEVRNLNMVSNIMRVVARHVGGKIVIVVGSNHKVFLEQYLSNMINVNIVQFNQLASSNKH